MNWLIFFIGVLVGWLVELIIDFVFWRKRYQGSATEARLRIELAGLEAKNSQLESQLVGCQEIRAQYATRTAELQACTQALQQLEARTSTNKEAVAPETGREVKDVEEREAEAAPVEPEIEMAERLAPASDAADVVPDDLRKIEGIGPKIAGILNDNGILTFAQLAEMDVSRLHEILKAAGPRYTLADPSTWPEQAQLAAQNDWDAFKALLKQLKGGRKVSQ